MRIGSRKAAESGSRRSARSAFGSCQGLAALLVRPEASVAIAVMSPPAVPKITRSVLACSLARIRQTNAGRPLSASTTMLITSSVSTRSTSRGAGASEPLLEGGADADDFLRRCAPAHSSAEQGVLEAVGELRQHRQVYVDGWADQKKEGIDGLPVRRVEIERRGEK